MNILNLLTKEKHVAGIEISDSVIRVAFLRPRKHSTSTTPADELLLIEEPLEAGVIQDGKAVDVARLGKALKTIWLKAKLNTNYAIVSIPDNSIYARIFSFPKSVEGARLSDAMRLAIGFQLPAKTETSYLDWERVTSSAPGLNEILLATIPRDAADGYMKALDIAGIKTLALESHTNSISRAISLAPNQLTLVTRKTQTGTTVFALQDNVLRFVRTLPTSFLPEKAHAGEIQKIKAALEAEQKDSRHPISILEFAQAKFQSEYASYPELANAKNPTDWLVAIGAVIRGRIPQGGDSLISLLPVGTEEAYAYQKATTFIALIRNMTIGVSLFFMVVFLGAYIFVLTLSQNAQRNISSLSVEPVSPDLIAKETTIKNVNELTSTGETILAETPMWSMVLDEINARTINGIIVSNITAPSIADTLTVTGTAQDRITLNQFKKTFQESPLFTDVAIPITNLEQRSDIPFSLTFQLKDPSLIYYK